jgi:hypothetical protein
VTAYYFARRLITLGCAPTVGLKATNETRIFERLLEEETAINQSQTTKFRNRTNMLLHGNVNIL